MLCPGNNHTKVCNQENKFYTLSKQLSVTGKCVTVNFRVKYVQQIRKGFGRDYTTLLVTPVVSQYLGSNSSLHPSIPNNYL